MYVIFIVSKLCMSNIIIIIIIIVTLCVILVLFIYLFIYFTSTCSTTNKFIISKVTPGAANSLLPQGYKRFCNMATWHF